MSTPIAASGQSNSVPASYDANNTTGLQQQLKLKAEEQNDLTGSHQIAKSAPVVSNIGLTEPESAPKKKSQSQANHRAYRKRFLILTIFVAYSLSNAFQWIQYAIVTSILTTYFEVSTFAISCTSMIYMIIYIPGILPSSYLLTKSGLRFCVILGALGTFTGSLIKCFCRESHQFPLLMVGQAVVAASQLFIINIPPNLAAVWFPSSELSSATAVGVFGNQLGVALGFVIPPIFITPTNTASGLNDLHIAIVGLTLVLLILILVFFDEKPPTPPSAAQAASELHNSSRSHAKVLRSLLSSVDFNLLFITYGTNVGVFYAMSTLLEPMVTSRFSGASAEAGQMGLLLTISGMFGSVICGIILDKTHLYKGTTLTLYTLSLLGMFFYTGALFLPSIWPLYLVCIFLGFFMTGYLPIGFEFAAELTYPQPEGTSAGLLNASAQFFGIILILVGTPIFENFGTMWTNLTFCLLLLVGTLLTARIRNQLNRQNAFQRSPSNTSDMRAVLSEPDTFAKI